MRIYEVLIPIILMITIILWKKLPKIGGNIHVALVVAGVSALLLGGIYSPITWLSSWLDGVNRLSWVMLLSIFGSIYAETQISMGTMETVLNLCRAKFGRSPRGLLVAIMVSLALAGSLLGDAIAVSTVVGILIIKPLSDMGIKAEEITATLVMGALLGSVCPPISSALFQAAGIVGVEPDSVARASYLPVIVAIILSCLYASFAFVHIKTLPDELIPEESASAIFRKGWVSLIPMSVLILIVILRTGPWNIDIIAKLFAPLINAVKPLPILQGLSNITLLAVFTVTVLSFLSSKVRTRGVGPIVKKGIKNVLPCTGIQIAAGFMLGAFYASGLIDVVAEFAQTLNLNMLKLGGSGAMMLVGMLTGSNSTAQSTILSFLGPALVSSGVEPVNVAAAGGMIATAGQAMPPADLATFVVAGLVGGILGVEVDCIKSMIKSAPGFIFLAIGGLILLYV